MRISRAPTRLLSQIDADADLDMLGLFQVSNLAIPVANEALRKGNQDIANAEIANGAAIVLSKLAVQPNVITWLDASAQVLADLGRTASLAFTDLDLTVSTSANTKFAMLELFITLTSFVGGYSAILGVRKNGTVPAYYPMSFVCTATGDIANASSKVYIILGLDAGQVLEYSISIAGTCNVSSWINVLGYIE